MVDDVGAAERGPAAGWPAQATVSAVADAEPDEGHAPASQVAAGPDDVGDDDERRRDEDGQTKGSDRRRGRRPSSGRRSRHGTSPSSDERAPPCRRRLRQDRLARAPG